LGIPCHHNCQLQPLTKREKRGSRFAASLEHFLRQHTLQTTRASNTTSEETGDDIRNRSAGGGSSSNSTTSLPSTPVCKFFSATQHPDRSTTASNMGDTTRLLLSTAGASRFCKFEDGQFIDIICRLYFSISHCPQRFGT